MSEYKTLDGSPRRATWMERQYEQQMRDEGVYDVVIEPHEAPEAFWNVMALLHEQYLKMTGDSWKEWINEMRFITGFHGLGKTDPKGLYDDALLRSRVTNPSVNGGYIDVDATFRFSFIEVLLDCQTRWGNGHQVAQFEDRVNENAKRFRVGVVLEGCRFAPLLNEHLHETIIRSTLLVLKEERLKDVDKAYRDAFGRVMDGDHAGSITLFITCVEEMFRKGLGLEGATLKDLNGKARSQKLISATVHAFIDKIWTLRSQSDGHAGGVADYDDAMLAAHLVGSILLHLQSVTLETQVSTTT